MTPRANPSGCRIKAAARKCNMQYDLHERAQHALLANRISSAHLFESFEELAHRRISIIVAI